MLIISLRARCSKRRVCIRKHVLYDCMVAACRPMVPRTRFMESYRSRFAALNRSQAIAVVVVTALGLAWCLYTSLTKPILEAPPPGPDGKAKPDSQFYAMVIDRVRHGEYYYDAAKAEFTSPYWSFRPTSLFHWRTPIYAYGLAALPGETGGITVVALLALLTTGTCFLALGRTGGPAPAFMTFLLVGPFAWCFLGGAYLFTELWAGILMALSIAAYALSRWKLAVAAALVALFIRELVLAYCLLCLVLALWERRRPESLAWLVGLALFAVFYGWHVGEVRKQIAGMENAQLGSWFRLGGTG